ncbi:MAG: hypothetical protein K9N48_02660 [Verrucomicrobia bacterium]|nr:hypothetical protein [Verrucomicrobiota bacterium]MCF7709261.1 hypothetical protein [Verrucomicrobiota bacterium]
MGRGRRGGGRGMGQAGAQGGGAGLSDFCVCPQCGHQEQHERGLPCVRKQCPDCGIPMVRQ